jgi:hypothetical protein
MAPSDKPVAAMTSRDILDLPLERISIGPGRHRQDMGDLQALADSMSEIGLLQPIGVTADFALVFGERRLRAARNLGWTAILARIVDVPSIVAGEYAENEVRKDFTPSERVAIAEAMIVVGDAESMTVTATSVFDRGNRYPAEGYEPADLPLIKTRLAAWSRWAAQNPPGSSHGAGGGRS